MLFILFHVYFFSHSGLAYSLFVDSVGGNFHSLLLIA